MPATGQWQALSLSSNSSTALAGCSIGRSRIEDGGDGVLLMATGFDGADRGAADLGDDLGRRPCRGSWCRHGPARPVRPPQHAAHHRSGHAELGSDRRPRQALGGHALGGIEDVLGMGLSHGVILRTRIRIGVEVSASRNRLARPWRGAAAPGRKKHGPAKREKGLAGPCVP